MSQLLDLIVWRKDGSSFSPYPGAQVFIYEPGTVTIVPIADVSAVPFSQSMLTNAFGLATAGGAAETAANRPYLTNGAQTADVRVVDSANAIDVTLADRSVGFGTTTLIVDASGLGSVIGAITFSDWKTKLAAYIGLPAAGTGGVLAGRALNDAISWLNRWDFWFCQATANINLNGVRAYNFPTRFGSIIEDASGILSADATTFDWPVGYLPWREFIGYGLDKAGRSGSPSCISISEQTGQLLIDSDPGSGVLRVAYYRKIPNLSLATDTLGLDLSAEDVVESDAIWRIRRMNDDSPSKWQADKAIAMESLRAALGQERAS